ncbi:MAG: RnfABCDGE type electron transport complex subunit D [Candidatus Omnitrophica bacterium]|nr:RnfABCDGE type electron transport complex subunit D [Candidatus Omnitrophota bacterium]
MNLKTQNQNMEQGETKRVFRTVKQEAPLLVKRSPYLHQTISTHSRVWLTVAALAPAALAAIFQYGLPALAGILNCLFASVMLEWIAAKICKRNFFQGIGHVFLYGLMLALLLHVRTPWWISWLGAFFSFLAANPARRGPDVQRFHPAFFGWIAVFFLYPVLLGHSPSLLSSPAVQTALLLPALGLVAGAILRWKTVCGFLASCYLVSWMGFHENGLIFSGAWTGVVLLAAFFGVTDFWTSPLVPRAKLIFSVAAGMLSAALVLVTGEIAGIAFGILIANGCVPLMDKK